MRTSQLLRVVTRGVNGKEDEKEKEDTAVSGHLWRQS